MSHLRCSLQLLTSYLSLTDASIEDLREKLDEQPGEAGAAEPAHENFIPDPTKVTYEEWGPGELQEAMMGRTAAYGIVERMSPNAWVDCGDDIFVLDLPPKSGFIRVTRNEEAGEGDPGELRRPDASEDRRLTSRLARLPEWISHFTAAIADADEGEAVRPNFKGRSRKFVPFRRPRLVLQADTLEAAIRGSDTFAESRVSRGFKGASLLARNAPWRSRPASERQRAFVAKRLGFGKLPAALATDEDGVPTKVQPKLTDSLPNLTKGEAATVLTRLQHGAKARWEKQAKAHNREVKAKRKEQERKDKETVKVGPLPK